MTTMPEPDPLETGTPQEVDEAAVLDELATEVDALEEVVDMAPLDHPHRLLLVHAHPDDETTSTGATMARYAAEHALVVLVTCTLGENGDVVVPDLAHLAHERDDALGARRQEELAAALEALGVREQRWLGGAGRWRDSDMMGRVGNEDPRSFWQADLDATDGPVAALVGIVRDLRPQVVVTYDENGGYGHPDHIQAHRVTVAAVEAAGDATYGPELGEPWQVAKLYYATIPRSSFERMRASFGDTPPEGLEDLPEDMGTPDAEITTRIDARDQLGAKMAALRAHRSQVDLEDPFWKAFAGTEEFAVEHYVLARGDRGPAGAAAGESSDGPEDDLFAGIG